MTQFLFFQLIFYEFLGFARIWGLELKRFWEFWMANLFGTHQEASSSFSATVNGNMATTGKNPNKRNSGAVPESSATKHNHLFPSWTGPQMTRLKRSKFSNFIYLFLFFCFYAFFVGLF